MMQTPAPTTTASTTTPPPMVRKAKTFARTVSEEERSKAKCRRVLLAAFQAVMTNPDA